MKTTDLWFTTFLIKVKKIPLSGYLKKDKNKLEFQFEITQEDWKKYKLEYLSSELSLFEQEMLKLKELLY